MQHGRSGMALDVVLAGPGFEEEFLARALPVQIGNRMIPIISPEDLIVTKVLAGRGKDLDDIRGVLSERGEQLQLDQIDETLATLEAAMGQSDLRPVFAAEVARWRARR